MSKIKSTTRNFKLIDNQQEWDSLIQESIDNHPLQLWGWGEQKINFGWQAYRIYSAPTNMAMQVLLKPIPGTRYLFGHIPRGPVRIHAQATQAQSSKVKLQDILKFFKMNHVTSLRFEPSTLDSEVNPFIILNPSKTYSSHILTNHTLVIDLTQGIDEIRSGMSTSCRYSVNKSAKQTSIVSLLDHPEYYPDVYKIYQETANKAGFGLYSFDYYKAQLTNMLGSLDVLISLDNQTGKPIAFLWNAYSRDIAFELYAGVSHQGRKLRANYNLKYQAILNAKKRGQKVYDFNGRLNDRVDSFKQSFGPTIIDRVPTKKIALSHLDKPMESLEYIYRQYKRYRI
ncbi:peptidoglycan bridge formation glycyltransferase FemA/FemB family protein [Candidatus Nomurabacteria bacterium]|nr:peptidoglycan bridge formation glycyltransferase FemA/FemB family protein [Candidatus Nomurabacteria bacterium]